MERARPPRRPPHHAGRWHEGQRHRRPARRVDPALRQHAAPVWNPDVPQPIDFFAGWSKVPEQETYDNAFKIQWELFLRHVALDEPFRWTLLEGAKGVQLAEIGLKSSDERRWLELPELAA